MSNWTGIDPGGTEQLWSTEIIFDMLSVFKEHEPCSRVNPQSPIFHDLETLHPEITWRNTDANGSFRPIFRKTNPLVKLGLTNEAPDYVEVSDLGNDLLSNEISINEIITISLKLHLEADGAASYRKICLAASELGKNALFSPAVIEFGISKTYDPELKNAAKVISQIETKNIVINNPTRRRRIKSFMSFLVTIGAFAESNHGWNAIDEKLIEEIGGSVFSKSTNQNSISEPSLISQQNIFNSGIATIDTNKSRAIRVQPNVGQTTDPIKRSLLLEKASNEHERLVVNLAKYFLRHGYEPLESAESFDVAVHGNANVICEVKSITKQNCKGQLRKAVVQLFEYSWLHNDLFSSEPIKIIVCNKDPRTFLPDSYMDFIQHLGLHLFWEDQGNFQTSDNSSLSTLTIPLN